MKDAILVNGITPKELTDTILKGVKTQIEDLKKEFTPKKPTELLTRLETAKLLKISLVTVHEWANNGILKPYKMGNRTYFKRVDIEQSILNSNKK